MTRFQPRPTNKAQMLRSNATDAEKALWQHLSRRQLHGFKFSRQMPVGPYICDFMCREARLVIELDGGQHASAGAYDRQRTEFIEASGYRVIRFWNHDVLGNIDGVLVTIADAIEAPPPPTPPASGRGAIKVEAEPSPPACGTGLPEPSPPACGRGRGWGDTSP